MWVASFGNGMRVGRTISTAIQPLSPEQVPFTILENPARNRLQIQGPTDRILQLELIDQQGRIVREFNCQGALQCDLSDLTTGQYYISCPAETGSRSIGFQLVH